MIFRVKRRTPGLHKWKIVWPYQYGNTKRPSASSTINQQKAWYFYWAVEALYKGKNLPHVREIKQPLRTLVSKTNDIFELEKKLSWLENKDVSFHVFNRSWF